MKNGVDHASIPLQVCGSLLRRELMLLDEKRSPTTDDVVGQRPRVPFQITISPSGREPNGEHGALLLRVLVLAFGAGAEQPGEADQEDDESDDRGDQLLPAEALAAAADAEGIGKDGAEHDDGAAPHQDQGGDPRCRSYGLAWGHGEAPPLPMPLPVLVVGYAISWSRTAEIVSPAHPAKDEICHAALLAPMHEIAGPATGIGGRSVARSSLRGSP